MGKKQIETKKIALVYSAPDPSWPSAKTIRENLIATYVAATQTAPQKFRINEVSYDVNSIQESISQIKKLAPDIIVIPESLPVPTVFLGELSQLKIAPEIHFHVYGDFTIQTHNWVRLEPILKNFRVRFYVASRAQYRLISRMLARSDERNLIEFPFPIDAEFFNFNKSLFSADLKDPQNTSDLKLFYSGRLSRQKGAHLLLQWLYRLRQETDFAKRVRIDFAGAFDDIGSPLWSGTDPHGSSYFSWRTLVNELGLESCVNYCGEMNFTQLCNAHHSHDAYVSLSLYHDEDYGMAPLEALSCGAPAILTDWGGFGSFDHGKDNVYLCRTQIDKNGLSASYQDFKKAVESIYHEKHSATLADQTRKRSARAALFASIYSRQALAGRLIKMISDSSPMKFTGFSKLMHAHSKRMMSRQKGVPPYKEPTKNDPIYFKTYECYTSVQNRDSI